MAADGGLYLVHEEQQDPNPPLNPYSGVHLHVAPQRWRHREGDGVNSEASGHVLGAAIIDLVGGDEHKSHLVVSVDEQKCVVIEGKAQLGLRTMVYQVKVKLMVPLAAVAETWELNIVHLDLRVLGPEEDEKDRHQHCHYED